MSAQSRLKLLDPAKIGLPWTVFGARYKAAGLMYYFTSKIWPTKKLFIIRQFHLKKADLEAMVPDRKNRRWSAWSGSSQHIDPTYSSAAECDESTDRCAGTAGKNRKREAV